MNSKNPQSQPYTLTNNPAKFSHRRINTQVQQLARNYGHRQQWQPLEYQSKPIQSMKFIKDMPSQYPRNNQYFNPSNNQKLHKDTKLMVGHSNTRIGHHRRIKTVIDPPQQNSTHNGNQDKSNPSEKKNTFASFENMKSDNNLIKETNQMNSNKNKESRFQKMRLEFSKYQASTAATSTPTGISTSKSPQYKYAIQGIAGKGTFGVVYFGRVRLTGEKIAIKKVLQDKRYKNRQLQILQSLDNDHLLKMKDHFFTKEGDQEYLNVIMDYFPDNLYQIIKKKVLTPSLIKHYTYQILKGLAHLSDKSIAHRDIKPQNILVDFKNNKIVICDFGSAKKLKKGESNIAYICSRCYRAPQLIFGAKQYSTQIDVWSLGCVVVQMINGQAPFLGDSQVDQLLEIIKIMGTPQKSEIQEMNPSYSLKDYNKFPSRKPIPWKKVLKCSDPLLADLVTKLLEYSPVKRLSAKQALEHPYFDQIRKAQNQVSNQEIDISLESINLQKTVSASQRVPNPKISSRNIEMRQNPYINSKNNSRNSSQREQEEDQNSKSKAQLPFEVKHGLKNKSPISDLFLNDIRKKEDSDSQLPYQKQELIKTRPRRDNQDRAQKLRDQMIYNKAQGNTQYESITKKNLDSHKGINIGSRGGHIRMRSDINNYQYDHHKGYPEEQGQNTFKMYRKQF